MTQTNPNPLATAGTEATQDPRDIFARAASVALATVGQIGIDQRGLPTPCGDYDVETLYGHVLGAVGTLAAVGRRQDPLSVAAEPPFAPVANWAAALADLVNDVAEAWADDASLLRMVVMPWAQLPGAAMLAMYTNELTVHTWDLAKATGQSPIWDEAVVAVAMEAIRQGLPAEGRILGVVPFGEVVEVSAGSAAIDQLVAWNGRQP